jgi:hypothetical protein
MLFGTTCAPLDHCFIFIKKNLNFNTSFKKTFKIFKVFKYYYFKVYIIYKNMSLKNIFNFFSFVSKLFLWSY